VLEESADATEPLRCRDCVHSDGNDGSAEHVAAREMRQFAVLKWVRMLRTSAMS